jgi:hypothetical protein
MLKKNCRFRKKMAYRKIVFRVRFLRYITGKWYTGGPDITCQKNSGSLEGSNKSEKPLFIRSKIMGIN